MGLFFKVRRPRGFNYQPIYYDERKEALHNRVERAKQELGQADSASTYRPDLKGIFTGRFRKQKATSRTKRPTLVKTLIALVVLLGVLYLLYRF